MIKKLLQHKEFSIGESREKVDSEQALTVMDQTELSLGPSLSAYVKSANSSSSESDANSRRKRKHAWDEPMTQTSIELQLNDPLPLDWEQCLDLQSGRMYYLNRKTLKKSWIRPKEQKLDLELNISTLPISEGKASSTTPDDQKKHNSSSGNMVAVVCVNCHLLVMICKSSPSCPNCKYVHALLQTPHQTSPRRMEAVKSLETLSLLH
ncbi:uncharacterized protein LOC120113062 [Phoenix dactylifera]|uniref:Uncharacterized protein LOC120113062 n=1 Tax=Phoenix dactylifera TaxID=42345 RepID=A0A8B9AVQ7_PHODC|nr:uncharacterized protein LOC120113062 [Phoenix dactylifera]